MKTKVVLKEIMFMPQEERVMETHKFKLSFECHILNNYWKLVTMGGPSSRAPKSLKIVSCRLMWKQQCLVGYGGKKCSKE